MLLNTDRICMTFVRFADPWKIDILDFMNKNYMNNLSIRLAVYGRSLATFKQDFSKVSISYSPERWLINGGWRRLTSGWRDTKGSVTDILFVIRWDSKICHTSPGI